MIDKKIKANTNLRIALRVQDANDSDDVIGTRQAASLGRGQPGRAFARFGSSEIVEFQTAIVSTPSRTVEEIELDVVRFSLIETEAPHDEPINDDPTDAEKYVEVIARANELGGYAPARIPWPDPLPGVLELPGPGDEVGEALGFAQRPRSTPIGTADLPEEQRQETTWWSPERGNTLLYGVSATCLSQSLASIVVGLAQRNSADDVHVYVLDYGNRHLAPLARLPHCGANVGLGHPEQTDRMIDLLDLEMHRRRAQPDAPWPMIVLVVDNYAAVLESFEERGQLDGATRLASIMRDGPGLGVFTFASSTTERGVPLRVASGIESKFVLRMGDPSAYIVFGLNAKEVPVMGPMRALDVLSKLEVQLFGISDLDDAVDHVSVAAAPPRRPPVPVRVLEADVELATLSRDDAVLSDDEWAIPIGVRASTLRTGLLVLPAGEHAIVAGGPRSGRSTTLASIAESVAETDPAVQIVAVTPRRSRLANHDAVDAALTAASTSDELEAALAHDGPLLVLIDDVESLPAELCGPLASLIGTRQDDRHVIVAGRTDTFRSPSSWCRPIRESRCGVMLNPAPTDGDIHKTQLPMRRPEAFPTGRGFLINQGLPERLQVAHCAEPGPVPVTPDHPTNNRSTER